MAIATGTMLVGLLLPLIVGKPDAGSSVATASGDGLSSFEGSGFSADGAVQGPDVPGSPGSANDGVGPAGTATTVAGTATTVAGGGGGGGGGTGPLGPLTASDRGVTPTEIRVGFLMLDLAAASRLGFNFPGVDPETQQKVYEAMVDDINARGGIHGRKIKPYFRAYDVTSAQDMENACSYLAEDVKVFAVVGQFVMSQPVLCLTETHKTPNVAPMTQGLPEFLLERSNGLLFSLIPSATRSMRNFAAELDRLGVIGDKQIGIMSDKFLDPDGRAMNALKQALGDAGHEVVHMSHLAADVSVYSGQVPVEANEMRRKGVDLVLLLSNQLASQQFAQYADGQQYFPGYAVTDFASMASDGGNANMPDSYDGTVAITSMRFNEDLVGLPEHPAIESCRRIVEPKLGRKVPPGDDAYYVMNQQCGISRIFELAAKAVGPNLTRPGFGAAAQTLGSVPEADTFVGGGTFGRGKFGYSDYLRTMRWEYACKCWKPVSNFARAKF